MAKHSITKKICLEKINRNWEQAVNAFNFLFRSKTRHSSSSLRFFEGNIRSLFCCSTSREGEDMNNSCGTSISDSSVSVTLRNCSMISRYTYCIEMYLNYSIFIAIKILTSFYTLCMKWFQEILLSLSNRAENR